VNRQVSSKELEASFRLPGAARYRRFIKLVADWEDAWGLYSSGWAMASTDSGQVTFPLWPARAFAEACANGEWEAYEASPIPLADLVDELIPKLERDGIDLTVFATPTDRGVVVSPQQLAEDLCEECAQYE
jgi:hypothetical protein